MWLLTVGNERFMARVTFSRGLREGGAGPAVCGLGDYCAGDLRLRSRCPESRRRLQRRSSGDGRARKALSRSHPFACDCLFITCKTSDETMSGSSSIMRRGWGKMSLPVRTVNIHPRDSSRNFLEDRLGPLNDCRYRRGNGWITLFQASVAKNLKKARMNSPPSQPEHFLAVASKRQPNALNACHVSGRERESDQLQRQFHRSRAGPGSCQ